MLKTLTDRRRRHNLELTEPAFGFDEGRAATCTNLILKSGVFAASRRMSGILDSWFETAQARLLTMRG
jgi:hypothetical protein